MSLLKKWGECSGCGQILAHCTCTRLVTCNTAFRRPVLADLQQLRKVFRRPNCTSCNDRGCALCGY